MANSNGNGGGNMVMIMVMMGACVFMFSMAACGYYFMMTPGALDGIFGPPTPVIMNDDPSAPAGENPPSSTSKKSSNSKSKSSSTTVPSKASAYILAVNCSEKGRKNKVFAAGLRGKGTGENSVSLWCKEPIKFYFDGPKAAGSEKFYYLRSSGDRNRVLMGWESEATKGPYLAAYENGNKHQQWVISKADGSSYYLIKNRGLQSQGKYHYLNVRHDGDCDNNDPSGGVIGNSIFFHSSGSKFAFYKSLSSMGLTTGDCPIKP